MQPPDQATLASDRDQLLAFMEPSLRTNQQNSRNSAGQGLLSESQPKRYTPTMMNR